MLTDAPNLNYLWCEIMVEELVRCGVHYFCLAPGSRSAPLISAASGNRKARTFVHIDERGLAFHAVGYVSGAGKPAALILTSGTAVAEALPAVIEASKKKLPLILLTADRPPEQQKAGARQTIEQDGLYGNYARWTFNLPCPSVDVPAAFILTTIDQAVSRAKGELPGPVHLNCFFREPLSPEHKDFPRRTFLASISSWFRSAKPYTTYVVPGNAIGEAAAEELAGRIGRMKNGIIAVGKLRSTGDSAAVLELSERTGFPVWPDITSGLRLGCAHPNVISYFDQLLMEPKSLSAIDIDGIIHVGGRMTSKRFYEFCGSLKNAEYISVLSHPLRNDPLHRVTVRVQADAVTFARTLMARLEKRAGSRVLSFMRAADRTVGKIIGRELSKGAFSEMAIARLVSQGISGATGLFLSNSMPVRDMDMYSDPAGERVVVGGNRGASGIDGVIASAAGFAVGLGQPVTLVIGDLAFLHDLSSLAMLSRIKFPLRIVLMNNDGGGVFSFLPIVNDRAVFERCIAAPHGLSFKKAAELFGISYFNPANRAGFRRDYSAASKLGRSAIIECIGSRKANLRAHLGLQRKITESLCLNSFAR